MEAEIKYTFPCGYTAKCYIKAAFYLGSFKFDDQTLPVCPIHKDKCKRQI